MRRQPNKKRCSGDAAWHRRIERFPPILVRLLARDPRGHPLTTTEIAQRSGLTETEVVVHSKATTWVGVDIPTYRAFCQACNLDLMNSVEAKRNESYLNGKLINGQRQAPQFLYLKRDPDWETYYKPLMARYLESLRNRSKVNV